MKEKTSRKMVPAGVRKEALRAIRKGKNLAAVAEANRWADMINAKSIYKSLFVTPFEII